MNHPLLVPQDPDPVAVTTYFVNAVQGAARLPNNRTHTTSPLAEGQSNLV